MMRLLFRGGESSGCASKEQIALRLPARSLEIPSARMREALWPGSRLQCGRMSIADNLILRIIYVERIFEHFGAGGSQLVDDFVIGPVM
jgi:hypothetical protein